MVEWQREREGDDYLRIKLQTSVSEPLKSFNSTLAGNVKAREEDTGCSVLCLVMFTSSLKFQ